MRVESAAFKDGNFARFHVNGRTLVTQGKKGGRGMNVVALFGKSHKVVLKKAYDTWDSKEESEAM